MESKKIAISKSSPLANRISETGRRVRDWLNVLDVPFDHAVDKLQLKKCEVRHGHCVYHYGIIRGTPSFALKSEGEAIPRDAGVFETPFTYLENSPDSMF